MVAFIDSSPIHFQTFMSDSLFFFPASRRPRLRFFSPLLVALLLAFIADIANAQPAICGRLVPGRPSDYYEARGCGLVQSVEQVHLFPGQERLRQHMFEQAASDFHFILAQFPNHPQALLLMAQTCEQWKSPRCRPEEYFNQAISINPRASGTFMAVGIYLHRAHQYPKAIESFRQAVKLDPNSVTAHYDLGLAYLETKQYDLANEQAQIAYANGASLPGLRDRLQRSGHWKPLDRKRIPEAAVAPPEGSQKSDNPVDEAPKK